MTESVKPADWRIWWQAARPKTLWAAFSPVLIGGALAAQDGVLHAPSLAAAALAAALIQIGTNLCNDWADFQKGADTEDRLGPVRVTQAGWVSPRAVLLATCLVFALAGVASLVLILRGGWPIAVVAVLSILSGIAYTAGPAPLAYTGWADLFVLVFFGPVAVGGTYFVQAQSLPLWVLAAGLPPGLLSVGILLVNNLRDREGDALAGKKTLVVRFGRAYGLHAYAIALLLPFGIIAGLVLTPGWPVGWGGLLVLVLFPLALHQIGSVRRTEGRAMNPLLGGTARFLLLFSLLFSAGVLL